MLKQRVITAVVLLAVLLPAVLADDARPFIYLTLAAVGAAAWEWGRLNGASRGVALALGVLVALSGGLAVSSLMSAGPLAELWWLVAALWVLGGPVVLRSGPAAWPRWPRALRWALGVALLWAAWLALSHAKVKGVNFLLSVFCLVWVADIAAYFGGRRFGRRKLAPAISPGKSWEGVASGMLGVLLLALAWVQADRTWGFDSPSLYTLLVQRLDMPGALAAVVVLTGLSVVGDLFESLVKRAAGAKDSSALLPGHGGFLDRIDALLPVFPVALALITWE
jgi:phosphatidate cytidylyltransferase